MRKTSQDGGDNTSITSGVENEIKKPLVGIIKTKRNSIKRKVQNFSHESDDAIIEPLLQKDKTDIPSQSAKHMLPKTKTESSSEKGDDRDKLLCDERVEKPSLSNAPSAIACNSIMNGAKEIINHKPKLYESSSTIHNHMNTNIFGSIDGVKNISTPNTKILVEIDSSKSTGYVPSPLIFTTAKIHTGGNMKHMEPVQVTPVPILSTIEGSVKIGVSCTDNILSGIAAKGMINTINIKSNNIESKTAKDTQNSKINVTVNNSLNTEIPCTLSSDSPSDKKDVKKNNPSNNTLANSSSIKSVVSVDINNVPTKTIKSDLNTVGTNASSKRTSDNKEVTLQNEEAKNISKICESAVDVNKNIETNKKISSQEVSSENYARGSSSITPRNEMKLDHDKDSCGTHSSNIDSKEKSREILTQYSTTKANDNDYNPKDNTSLPACPKTNLISSPNNVPVSIKTSSSVQIATPILTSKNVTSVNPTKETTTSTITESTGVTIISKSVTSTSTSLVSEPASITAMSVKTATTNAVSTNQPTVLNELSSGKATVTTQASDILKKSVDVSATKMSMTTPSTKIKSTVSTIISTPKLSATKTIPTTSSSDKNVTSVIKTPSTQLPPANTVSSTVAVTKTNTNLEKSVDSSAINSKFNNVTKTISSTVDSKKPLNIPLTNVVANATSSTVSTAKATEIPTKATKLTSSISNPSTSVSTSKPAGVTSAATSSKQPSTKSALAKPNSSSVKTLITSSDKTSSTSGSVKNSSIKTSNKVIESKGANSKKA